MIPTNNVHMLESSRWQGNGLPVGVQDIKNRVQVLMAAVAAAATGGVVHDGVTTQQNGYFFKPTMMSCKRFLCPSKKSLLLPWRFHGFGDRGVDIIMAVQLHWLPLQSGSLQMTRLCAQPGYLSPTLLQRCTTTGWAEL
jgi:hypothetical protein